MVLVELVYFQCEPGDVDTGVGFPRQVQLILTQFREFHLKQIPHRNKRLIRHDLIIQLILRCIAHLLVAYPTILDLVARAEADPRRHLDVHHVRLSVPRVLIPLELGVLVAHHVRADLLRQTEQGGTTGAAIEPKDHWVGSTGWGLRS